MNEQTRTRSNTDRNGGNAKAKRLFTALLLTLFFGVPALSPCETQQYEWCTEHVPSPDRKVGLLRDRKPRPMSFYRGRSAFSREDGKLEWTAEETSVTETWLGEFDSTSVYSVVHWKGQYAILIALVSGPDTDTLVPQYVYYGSAVAPDSMVFSSVFRRNDIPILVMDQCFYRECGSTVFILKSGGFLLLSSSQLHERLGEELKKRGLDPGDARESEFYPFNCKLITRAIPTSSSREGGHVALAFNLTPKGFEVTGFEDNVDRELLDKDEHLNGVYNLLSRQLPRNRWKTLIEEQRSWIVERDRKCAAMPDAAAKRECMLEETEKRSGELQKLIRNEWIHSPSVPVNNVPDSVGRE